MKPPAREVVELVETKTERGYVLVILQPQNMPPEPEKGQRIFELRLSPDTALWLGEDLQKRGGAAGLLDPIP